MRTTALASTAMARLALAGLALGLVALAGLALWSTGGAYLNFAERHKAGTALFGADTYRRLQQVKATYDPADIIRSNHPIVLPS